MKLRFINPKNYHSLTPPISGIPSAQVLDEYLARYINDNKGDYQGAIDVLIKQNEKTINIKNSVKRLVNSPIEIAIAYNFSKETYDFSSVARPSEIKGEALLHTVLQYENGITWKTSVPLQYLLKGWGDAAIGYQCYVHSISTNISQTKCYADLIERQKMGIDDYKYAGITGRNWLERFREHMSASGRGSRLKFHSAWREYSGKLDVYLISCLGPINLSYQDAMDWEEVNVDRLGPTRLNMIPGGFKGLTYLHTLGITSRKNIQPDERDVLIIRYFRGNTKKGIPNPFISEWWKDDQNYLKAIESKKNTLSSDQVIKIRELVKNGLSIPDIVKEVNARNSTQVKNVISGRTFRRIH